MYVKIIRGYFEAKILSSFVSMCAVIIEYYSRQYKNLTSLYKTENFKQYCM